MLSQMLTAPSRGAVFLPLRTSGWSEYMQEVEAEGSLSLDYSAASILRKKKKKYTIGTVTGKQADLHCCQKLPAQRLQHLPHKLSH